MNDTLQDFRHALAPRIAGELLFDEMSRALYATDASRTRLRSRKPPVSQSRYCRAVEDRRWPDKLCRKHWSSTLRSISTASLK